MLPADAALGGLQMLDNQSVNARTAERFAIRNLEHVYAVVERGDAEHVANLLAEPLDISEGGIKLRLDVPLNFEESIRLILGCVEGPFRMTVSSRVAWLRQDNYGPWLVGCQFVPKLQRDVLEEMFSSGIIERRQFTRRPIQGRALAKWQLEPDLFGVQLIDISESGFCIRSSRPGQVGQRIRLSLEPANGTSTVQAKAQWCMKVDDCFLVGCAFVDHDGWVSLSEALYGTEAHLPSLGPDVGSSQANRIAL
jgi:hypothetical protein